MTVYHFTRASRPRFVQVWLDEWPDSEYDPAAVLQHRLAVTGNQPVGIRWIAVEWRTPSCGPSSYGLLGAEYTYSPDEGCLTIEVALANDEPVNWRAARVDTTRRGLTKEYSQSVFDGLLHDHLITRLGPGQLRVACAANDVVGSSNVVFGWLARAISRILTAEEQPLTEGRIRRLLDFDGEPF